MTQAEPFVLLPKSPLDGWEMEALQGAQLGNSLRTARCCLLARDLAAQPQASIPNACGSWAKTKAAYRFFDLAHNDPEDPDTPSLDAPASIRKAYFSSTKRRLAGKALALAVQDTTDLNLPHNLSLKVHSTLALSLAGVPLGLLSQLVWAREPEQHGKSSLRKELDISQKESAKWIAALHESHQDLPSGTTLVHVGDREADVYDLFLEADQLPQTELLIRACRDRKVNENSHLFAWIQTQRIVEIRSVELPRRDGCPGRIVLMGLRYGRVTLKPPKHRKGENLPNLVVDVVFLQEMYPIDPKKRVEWLLLTTVEVESEADAWERVRWYRLRWRVERYHYVLKSGCKIEKRQLETAGRMNTCVAMYSVVACRILELIYLSREEPNLSAISLINEEEWRLLYSFRHPGKAMPKEPPSLREVIREIAGLGGFLGRKSDGEPGVKTLWQGWQRLQDILSGYYVAKQLFSPSQKNLGNE